MNLGMRQSPVFSPVAQSNFAVALGDYTTLSTTSSMPTGGLITRAGNAMLYDSTGKLTWAPNNLIGRSNDLNSASWTRLNSLTVASGISDPVGGTNAQTLTAGAGNAQVFQAVSFTSASSYNFVNSIWVRRRTGTGVVTLYKADYNTGTNLTLTTSWQQFSVSGVGGASNAYFNLIIATSGDAIDVYMPTLSVVTYETSSRAVDQVFTTTTAAYYGPRFDYDPSVTPATAKGLLVEGARTNVATGLSTFTSLYAALTTTSAVTSPDGTTNAYLFDEQTASSIFHQTLVAPSGLTASTAYSASIYVKAGTGRYITITNAGATNLTGGYAVFDLTTGTVTQSGALSTGTLNSSSATSIGNGWWRLTVVATSGDTIRYFIVSSSDAATYSPDSLGRNRFTGTSKTYYLFGPQLEAGVFPSSYIPGVVTRAAETFTLSNYQNRLVESFYIDEQTGGSWSANINASATSPLTISTPTFGWVTSLRTYTNAYAGDITTPSWIDNSGTTGNRMYYDSTGALTWAPANLVLQSQTFNTTWTLNAMLAFGSGSIVDATAAPDGTTTADKLTPNTASSAHNFYQSYTYSAASHTLSIYAKAAGYSFIKLGSMFSGNGVEFNLSAGTVGTASAGYIGAITSVGNGWYRCSVTWTASAGADLPGAYVYAATGTVSFAGDGVSGVFFWGAQLEPVTYQTSPRAYIPTTSAAVYQPRYDYDPSVTPATPRGMLIEEQRVNLVLNSENFNAGTWSPSGILQILTTSVSTPSGIANAQLIVEDTSSGNAHRVNYTYSGNSATQYSFSAYLKASGRTWGRLYVDDAAGNGFSGYFNLTTGAKGTLVAVGAGVASSSSIQSVGNGWYRCTITGTPSVTTTGSVRVQLGGTTGDNVGSYTGDGVSGVYIWGAQLEAGSFVTSYIPTTSASVTRVADVVKLSGSALTTLQGSNWTLIGEVGKLSTIATSQGFIGTGDFSKNAIRFNGSPTDLVTWQNNGSTYTFSSPVSVLTNNTRVGLSGNASGTSSVASNGTVVTGGTVSWAVNAVLGYGASGGSNPLNSTYRSIAVYNQRLPDAILKQKSTVGSPY